MVAGDSFKTLSYHLVAGFAGVALVYGLLGFHYATELPDFGLLGSTLLYGAVFEEVLKFALTYALYKWSGQPVVALLVGLSFGLGEQSLYLYSEGAITLKTIVMHTVSGFASMYFLRKYKESQTFRNLLFALLAPIGVHGIYNVTIWLWYQWVLLS